MSCSSPAARTSEVTDHLVVVLKITLVVFIASSLLDMGLPGDLHHLALPGPHLEQSKSLRLELSENRFVRKSRSWTP